jgi:hypothetical protein
MAGSDWWSLWARTEKVFLLTNDGDNPAALFALLLQHHSLMRGFRPKPSMKTSLPIEATGKDHSDASET